MRVRAQGIVAALGGAVRSEDDGLPYLRRIDVQGPVGVVCLPSRARAARRRLTETAASADN